MPKSLELQTIKFDQLNARKVKNKVKANLLTTVIGEVENQLKVKLSKSTQPVVLDTVLKFVKNLKESIKLRHTDLAEQELKILEEYLPKPLTDEEIGNELTYLTQQYDKESKQFKGLVMKHFNNKFKGQFDSKTIMDKLNNV